jgi:hypothetical protein
VLVELGVAQELARLGGEEAVEVRDLLRRARAVLGGEAPQGDVPDPELEAPASTSRALPAP